MDKFKIGVGFALGLILFVNVAAYFTTSAVGYGVDIQQLTQIKHLIWIAIAVYIGGQLK